MSLSRRDFIKLGTAATIGVTAVNVLNIDKNFVEAKSVIAAPITGSENITCKKFSGSRAKVYFTKHIDSQHLIKLYNYINDEIYGKVAIKVHTGEPEGPNILPRDMVRDFQQTIPGSNIVESCDGRI